MTRDETIDDLLMISNAGTKREDIERAYAAGMAATNPETNQEKLLADLKTVEQALREMHHAAMNPDWFSKGQRGATSQFLSWSDKGRASLIAITRDLPLTITNATAAEREACAQVCQMLAEECPPGDTDADALHGAADDIRARGTP